VNIILCQNQLAFVRAERDEIQRTCCENPAQAWWSSSEITLHGGICTATLNKLQRL
jgi:hypothetical protein